MIPDHDLDISSPSGIGRDTYVKLDGEEVYPQSIKVEIDGDGLVMATVVFAGASLKYRGTARTLALLAETDPPQRSPWWKFWSHNA